jgi:DHA1 family bicyclomycin/chloramphenicol resistance-like MFS transporter
VGAEAQAGSVRDPAAVLSAGTVVLLIATLSMLQPLATDLYLPTLPGIAAAFAANPAQVQWTLSFFVIAFGTWQLVVGPVSDRFGRRPVVLAGIVTYGAASVLCALAPSIEVLVAARVLQAIGACSCVVGARGLVRDLFAPSEGARLTARAATWLSLAPLAAPIVGAWLFERFGWRSAFIALAAFAGALLALNLFKLRESNQQRNPHALHLRPMWATYRRVSASPVFRAYTAVAAVSYAGLFAFISGSSFVLQGVLELRPQEFGFTFSMMVAGYLIGTLVCRRIVARAGIQRAVMTGAAVQCAAGLVLAALAPAGVHHAAAIVAPMIVFGVSHGIVQAPAQAGAVAPFPHSAGAAAALLGFLMMGVAAAIGFWIGASYNGTVYPLTLTIGACALTSALIASRWVRRDGNVSHLG